MINTVCLATACHSTHLLQLSTIFLTLHISYLWHLFCNRKFVPYLCAWVQASHSPPVSPSHLPTSQGVLSPPCRTLGLGRQIWSPHCSLPREGVRLCNLPFPLSPLPGTQVQTWSLFFISYLMPCGSFLQPWLYSHLSASFQLFFRENCSMCRYIFDVFTGGFVHGSCPPTPPSYIK